MSDYLSEIDQITEQIPYGEVQITLKRHDSKTTKLSLATYDHKRFADNVEAATYLMQTVKNLTDSGQSGSISFTLMLKNGKIGEVIQQGYQSTDYR